jgi:hypothetical protein
VATRVSLGAVIGVVVSLLSLNGNRTVHGVTLFPDLLSPLVLSGLTCLAVWRCARREQNGISAGQIGRTIAVTAGLIFATVMTVLGLLRFRHDNERVSLIWIAIALIIFLTALVAAIVCGLIAGAIVKRLVRHSHS